MRAQTDLPARIAKGLRTQPAHQDAQLRTSIEELSSLASAIVNTTAELEALGYPLTESWQDSVDFYPLVRKFEVWLIQRALMKTRGSQTKAAALLNLKISTLNSKIKSFEIS